MESSPYSVHNFPVRNDRIILSLSAGIAIINTENLNSVSVISKIITSELKELKIRELDMD